MGVFIYIILGLYGYIGGITYFKSIKVSKDKKKCLKMAILWPIDFIKEWGKTVSTISNETLAKLTMKGVKE